MPDTTTLRRPKGTTDDPIRQNGERCAYRGCRHHGQLIRLTSQGIAILYCSTHYDIARPLTLRHQTLVSSQ